jgi:glycosyltransferase involved in cell wall biosynthesis
MKLAITTFGCDGGKSGLSRYLIEFLRELALLAPSSWQIEIFLYEEEASIFIPPKHPFHLCFISSWFRPPIRNLLWHQGILPLWCYRRAYDLLFLPAANRRIPFFTPCSKVGTFHDFASLHLPGKYDRLRTFYLKRILPFLARGLDAVFTVSERSKKDLVEVIGIPEKRIRVTPLAINPQYYKPGSMVEAQRSLQEKYVLPIPYFLYVSRLEHPGKNHIRLIEAFERLKKENPDLPHHLIFVGSDWSRSEEIHRYAEASVVASQIHFMGFVPESDLPDFYRGATLFLFPSLFEGFGIPVLEAMSCGIPVLCSNTSSLPEVGASAVFYFDPYSVDALLERLHLVLKDPELQQDYIQKGLARSREFSWKKMLEQSMEVFEKLTSS